MCYTSLLALNVHVKPFSNRTVPKRRRLIMAEIDCDVHYLTVGNIHWMFDPRLTDIASPFGGYRNCILTNICYWEFVNDVFLTINNPDNSLGNCFLLLLLLLQWRRKVPKSGGGGGGGHTDT